MTADIAREIWDLKYRLKDASGAVLEADIDATWDRVAKAAAAAEPPQNRSQWEAAFRAALADYRFLPAGRILAGAGTDRQVTLFNCFVMGTIPDSISGIFDHLREAALTLQQGGGIGYDFSTIRPKGAPVLGVGADASGPLSFMDVWDAMCRTIMSAGARRGAMMACLSARHPDIEAFIEAKRDPARLRNFNLSVLVGDDFMTAVKTDASWTLVFAGRPFKTLPARALWDNIMRATYDVAEPGVIFIDRINAENNLGYCERIAATNPCGEQPLPPYGACLLGSLNLVKFIEAPFTEDARLDLAALEAATRVAVRFLDNVIDVSRYPLPEQEREARAKRRIGLGVTGLADAFVLLGIRYGSDASIELTKRWLALIERSAYLASAEIAAEKGSFPLLDAEALAARPGLLRLDEDVRTAIAEKGLRNGLLTSIAPTGTISLFAGNVSSGIEPVFRYEYKRRVLQADGTARMEAVEDYAHALYRRIFGADRPLTEAFIAADALRPIDHLRIQAAAQPFIDSAISKTVNLPEDIPFEDFKSVYLEAYRLGCKGCTTFRPNAVTGSVLSAPEMPQAPKPKTADIVYIAQPLERPETLPGETYKVRWPASDHAIYITLNDIVQEGRRRPFEIFINSKNMEHYAWTVALTRMISAVFRRGGDVRFVVEELKAVFDPQGGHWLKGRYVPSLLAAIGGVIEQHMRATGFISEESVELIPSLQKAVQAEGGGAEIQRLSSAPQRIAAAGRPCPRCGEPALIQQEGCATCLACGYSKCS